MSGSTNCIFQYRYVLLLRVGVRRYGKELRMRMSLESLPLQLRWMRASQRDVHRTRNVLWISESFRQLVCFSTRFEPLVNDKDALSRLYLPL